MVAAGLCKRVEISVSYAIGMAKPFSLFLDTYGTGIYEDEKLLEIVEKEFDFRPQSIIQKLDLRRPIYFATASYGHFGRDDLDLSWEKLDRVEELKKYL